MNKLKVKAAGQCSFKLSGFFFYRPIIKSQEADSWLFIFIKWKFILMLCAMLYDNRKLG